MMEAAGMANRASKLREQRPIRNSMVTGWPISVEDRCLKKNLLRLRLTIKTIGPLPLPVLHEKENQRFAGWIDIFYLRL